jgi:hypothetical protein
LAEVKTAEMDENPLRHASGARYLEIDLVCTKQHREARIRLIGDTWIALGKTERYRAWCPCEEIWPRVVELSDKENTLDWGLDKG